MLVVVGRYVGACIVRPGSGREERRGEREGGREGGREGREGREEGGRSEAYNTYMCIVAKVFVREHDPKLLTLAQTVVPFIHR